jgi:uncharacterized membrane protein
VSFYSYRSGEPKVRFFVVQGPDGNMHAAIDACDVCRAAALGFHQNGTNMTCNSCGKEFPIDGLGTANLPGGCWPAFLPFQVQQGYLLIDTEVLDSKAYMFR